MMRKNKKVVVRLLLHRFIVSYLSVCKSLRMVFVCFAFSLFS